MFQLHKSSCFNSDHRMSETFMSFFMLSMMMQSLICFSKQYSYINYSSDTSCCVRVKNMFSFFGALSEKVYISNCILEADFITSAASYNSFSYHMSYLNSAIRMVNGTPMMFWVSWKDGQPLNIDSTKLHFTFLPQMKTWWKQELSRYCVWTTTDISEIWRWIQK